MNIAGSHSQLDMEVVLQILHFIIVGMISAKLGLVQKIVMERESHGSVEHYKAIVFRSWELEALW